MGGSLVMLFQYGYGELRRVATAVQSLPGPSSLRVWATYLGNFLELGDGYLSKKDMMGLEPQATCSPAMLVLTEEGRLERSLRVSGPQCRNGVPQRDTSSVGRCSGIRRQDAALV